MPFFRSFENAENVAIQFLKIVSLTPISPERITEELEKHPHYPSMLALADVFNSFEVPNNAYHVSEEDLPFVPLPFIAHTNLQNHEFVLVTSFKNNNLTIVNEKFKKRIRLNDFGKIFNGVVLCCEYGNRPFVRSSRSTLFIKKAANLKPALWGLILVTVFATIVVFDAPFLHFINSLVILLLVIKSAGLLISVFLLLQSINSNNLLIQKLCSAKKNNCNNILSSKAATVFEGLTWSEVGFFYFGGTWLNLIINTTTTLPILGLLNVLSIPYTFFSIYYQARVAKQWCMLCCSVQALLWLEFACFASNLHTLLNWPTFLQLTNALVCFTLPILFWTITKPILVQLKLIKPLRYQLRQFKYNSEIFNRALQDQPKFALPDKSWSIVLGNKESNKVIIMVSNPYCQPCAVAHEKLHNWLKHDPDLQVRIVFTANNDDDDVQTPISRHLISINLSGDHAMVANALHNWYSQDKKDYEKWAKAYPTQTDTDAFHSLTKQRLWCEMVEIKSTPTFFVNGSLLPSTYKIEDIRYML